MRCKNCHYSLKNLTAHRCPECGLGFDPDDPRTFVTRLPAGIFQVLLLGLIAYLTGFGVLYLFRSSLTDSRDPATGVSQEVQLWRVALFAALLLPISLLMLVIVLDGLKKMLGIDRRQRNAP